MLKKNHKGFSLVEVMISMAVLAMLSLPLLTFFANSAKTGNKAAQMQAATALGDSIMEEMKAYPSISSMLSIATNAGIAVGGYAGINPDTVTCSGIATTYETDGTVGNSSLPSLNTWVASSVSKSGVNWVIPTTKPTYYLERRNILYGNHWFDARIVINPDYYSNGSDNINDRKLKEIQLVDGEDSVSYYSTEDEAKISKALLENQLNNLDKAEAERENAKNGITTPVTSVTKRPISIGYGIPTSNGDVSGMVRTTYVDVAPASSSAVRSIVHIWSEYSCFYQPVTEAAISGGYQCVYGPVNEKKNTILTKDLNRIYLFTYHSDLIASQAGGMAGVSGLGRDDKISINIGGYPPGITPPCPELYIAYQKPSGSAINANWRIHIATGSALVSNIHTNVDKVINSSNGEISPKPLIQDQAEAKDRIAKITVEIYDAGYLHTAEAGEHLRNTYESTVSLSK